MTDIEYWYWLCSLKGAGPLVLFPLLYYLGCSEEERKRAGESDNHSELILKSISADKSVLDEGIKRLFLADRQQLVETGLITGKKADAVTAFRHEDSIRAACSRMYKAGIRLVPYTSEEYPRQLKQLYDPPLGLFVKGRLPGSDEWIFSSVGARACSEHGRSVARLISRGLAFAGMSIVSGMARGIDSASHWGCLDTGGRTYAVLGCGPDICYPAVNIELYENILETGGIISEYPPGEEPLNWHFPLRNRIIAALAKGIIVVEARKKSGSLITAERGLELNRDIFAVPGRSDDILSEGCNDLIRAGATLVTSPADVLDCFGLPVHEYKRKQLPMDSTESKIFSRLTLMPQSADDIMEAAELDISTVSSALTVMEIKGLVKSVGKNQYMIKI